MRMFLAVMMAGALAAGGAEVAELVRVQDGQILPTNAVAHIQSLADTAAEVQAALARASAVEEAANMVSNSVEEIRELENARNATGYIRGFVESFSPGLEADTNLTASIVKFQSGGYDGTNVYWDIYTFFTSDPGAWPVVRTSGSAGRTNAWDETESVDVTVTNILVGSTLYEAYRNRVRMSPASTSAFFRVFCDIAGGGTNQMHFPVRNGIAVNGVAPLTATVTDGTNTMEWLGGVRVR